MDASAAAGFQRLRKGDRACKVPATFDPIGLRHTHRYTPVGASKVTQLQDNISATEITLSAEHMAKLTEISAPIMGFTSGLGMPMIRRMVFGGNDVVGWNE